MFGYTVPAYGRLSPADLSRYRRYYCEGCHQLRDGYGLTGTGTVNYDMTFNTILLEGLVCDCPDFGPTTRRICVLDSPKADSRLMHEMAAYTLILTKWELYDDETDMPSMKTKLISLTLNRAIQKAVSEFPEYDRMVGEGFMRLRDMELAGCRDAISMGREFGRGLTGPLEGIAGDFYTEDLGDVFTQLTAAVYVMDAIDDLDDDFMDGTYNPLLPETGYVNARTLVDRDVMRFTSLVSEAVGSLQSAYSRVRPSMRGNVSLCDNIVYFGIPESAKRVIMGDAKAKASVKNILSNRKDRLASERSGGVEVRAHVQGVPGLRMPGAHASAPRPATATASRTVSPASVLRPRRPGFRHAHPYVIRMRAEAARAALPVALVHGRTYAEGPYRFPSAVRRSSIHDIPRAILPAGSVKWLPGFISSTTSDTFGSPPYAVLTDLIASPTDAITGFLAFSSLVPRLRYT